MQFSVLPYITLFLDSQNFLQKIESVNYLNVHK